MLRAQQQAVCLNEKSMWIKQLKGHSLLLTLHPPPPSFAGHAQERESERRDGFPVRMLKESPLQTDLRIAFLLDDVKAKMVGGLEFELLMPSS